MMVVFPVLCLFQHSCFRSKMQHMEMSYQIALHANKDFENDSGIPMGTGVPR